MTAAPPMGPYETEQDTYGEPLPAEVRQLHAAGMVRSGDPGQLVSGAVLHHLHAACAESRVTLGRFDERILAWLAGWEPDTAQVVIGMIRRAYAAGRAER